MSEEEILYESNNNLPEEERLSKAQLQKQRNVANNTNTVRNLADVASKTNNPYAKAIGSGIKAADKLTGGKSSERLGKALSRANRITPGGRLLQKSINKTSESGMTNKLASAFSQKDSTSKGKGFNFFNTNTATEETRQEEIPEGGNVSFSVVIKDFKWPLIIGSLGLIVMVLCVLLIAAPQIYLNSIGLGNADSVSNGSTEEVENKINQNIDEEGKLNQEIKDESNNETDSSNTPIAFNTKVTKSSVIFKNNKLQKSNLLLINDVGQEKKNVYNEADLSQLYDYYSDISTYTSDEYDMNVVYKFFFKLLYIQRYYFNQYGVNLDMPLLMATLRVQSSDMGEVFTSNVVDYDVSKKAENEIFASDKDWSNYKPTKTNSSHDIEILAQHMVSREIEESCVNASGNTTQTKISNDYLIAKEPLTCGEGETYKTIEKTYKLDPDKYRDYLKEFLEKKYFLNDDSNNENDTDDNTEDDNSFIQNNVEWRTWKQCGGNWGNLKIGNSNFTMCTDGCLITSLAIQIARSGTITTETPINPKVAMENFNFTSEADLYWGSVNRFAPNFKEKTSISLVGMSKASIAKKLSQYNYPKYYIILGVSKGGNSISHYVALDYVDNSTNNIYIIDPAKNDDLNLYSKYKVIRAIVYEKKD